ncbi:restriction endonuclease [Streptomyces sp. NPDC001544]|uniref:restriction endonuclease n=1 Tax=Streptomyces sp. NPDC001544 TaxID=3364584 RepID=UPI0036A385C4
MTTTVHDVLHAIRQKAKTNRELGTAFERLMVRFLSTDPVWSEQFSRVWMYGEWPGAAANHKDLGIDLVAQERNTGAVWAIQCKFYEAEHTVQKADIDSFFTASGKGGFAHRLIISTTDKWGPNAEAALDDQQIPAQRLGLSDIAASPIEWRLPSSGDAATATWPASPDASPAARS